MGRARWLRTERRFSHHARMTTPQVGDKAPNFDLEADDDRLLRERSGADASGHVDQERLEVEILLLGPPRQPALAPSAEGCHQAGQFPARFGEGVVDAGIRGGVVVSVDEAGNRSGASEVVCIERRETTSFWDACEQEDDCVKGFDSCSLGLGSRKSWSGVALALVGLALLLRRRRTV